MQKVDQVGDDQKTTKKIKLEVRRLEKVETTVWREGSG